MNSRFSKFPVKNAEK